jgi:hypothetical protein
MLLVSCAIYSFGNQNLERFFGGLLMGVREDKFELDTCITAKYFTFMVSMDKET